MGSAIALRTASEGASLVLTDISQGRLDIAAGQVLEEYPGTKIVAHRASVLVASDVQGLLDAVADLAVDALVNVVGGLPGRSLSTSFLDVTEEEWRATFELNHMGMFHLVRALAPGMRERGFGRMLFTSSVAAFTGGLVGPHYAASKAGLHALVHYIANRTAADGVTVNAIAPALIKDTGDLSELAPVTELAKKVPVGRLGTPAEVADMALAMLRNGYLTNQVVLLDGGMHPR